MNTSPAALRRGTPSSIIAAMSVPPAARRPPDSNRELGRGRSLDEYHATSPGPCTPRMRFCRCRPCGSAPLDQRDG
jgi:hypothetical protein